MFKKTRRTKIVSTLGPSTDYKDNLKKIINAGVNVVRLNFSHGNSKDHLIRAKKVREIAFNLKKHIAIIGDLQGPKIRILKFKNGKILLKKGDLFLLDSNLKDCEGNQKKIGIDYKNLPEDVIPNDILLLDDGRIKLKVIKIKKKTIFTKIIIGGVLSDNKGINKLGGGLSVSVITEKDKKDIILASKIGVDYLAVSFPSTSEDLNNARYLLRKAGSNAKIISKIERAEAVISEEIMDNIILASDVVMVARGDLGVEIGDTELVNIQKKIIKRSRTLNRVVITATQMMESMINNQIPTRAEVMDVANAVLDGTDAVMLSAETATGKYPVETVLSMSNICLGAEKIPSINISKHRLNIKFNNIEDTISMSAMYAANHLKGITAIISITESGKTALIMSRISSGIPIYALSRHQHTLNLTSLYRGVTPIYFNNKGFLEINNAIKLLYKKGFLSLGDLVIVTNSDLTNTIGSTNTLRVVSVK